MTESPSWAAFLERGKREEGRGRLDEAEAAYRLALDANPGFDSLHRELARFLEGCGRLEESAEHLARAMALGWPRAEGEAALSRLRGKLEGGGNPNLVLIHSFLEGRRYAEAVRALKTAAAASREEGESFWPDVFSALLCARRYRQAFGLGEEMLSRSARLPFANGFLWPWWHGVSSRASAGKTAFCAAELERVRRAGRGGGFEVWFAYLRGVLLLGLGENAPAMAEYARIRRARDARYAMMHHAFVMQRLMAGDLEWTIAECRALLRHAPDYWWFQCRLAEAHMADGDVPRGLAEFGRAAAAASDVRALRAVTTWHGAALLWAGRYRAALRKLDEGAAIGTRIWVHCWRGAAYLKLGERRKALADLDAAVATDPQDLEAHLWRGEALRLMGRTAEALRALDRALELDPRYAWAYFNRALARDDAGDAEGMAADFARIPPELASALRGPKAGAPGRAEMRAVLERGLRRAKGIRRPESYLNAIWLGARG
ncbi:MAG: tetratricopeptide repeat protein [Elusimicrobia bacterium]|nr:tetratricopeptide repeat protein [Elusimicrobiota bacterium]